MYSIRTGNVILDRRASIGRITDGVFRHATIADNALYALDDDAGFVDAESGDYRFRPDANALKKIPGWEPTPFERIGHY